MEYKNLKDGVSSSLTFKGLGIYLGIFMEEIARKKEPLFLGDSARPLCSLSLLGTVAQI